MSRTVRVLDVEQEIDPDHMIANLLEAASLLDRQDNPNSGTPRMTFQWYWALQAPETLPRPNILNVGCADDPAYFGALAMHYDIDDWSAVHDYFTQGDAHHLPFKDREYHTVLISDVHEHVKDPWQVTMEGARVAGHRLAMTIFEELRLPSPGQHIVVGQALSDEHSRALGYADRLDAQAKLNPERKGFPDDEETPHLVHINQFIDSDITLLLGELVNQGFVVETALKVMEVDLEYSAEHHWWNWLLSVRRGGAA